MKQHWKEWHPTIEYDDSVTLSDVLHTMPGNDPTKIHWIVKFFENPDSYFGLPGSIHLFEHDVVHILLGRGLLPQDEAFVVGYTMGNDRHIKNWQLKLFKFIARHIYPKVYKFNKHQLQIFDLGVKFGKQSQFKDIAHISMSHMTDITINELKKIFDIDNDILKEYYREEVEIISSGKVTTRIKGQLNV